MKNNNIRLAKTTDIQNIVVLINTAYRSNRGWTHEHKMVAGQRINCDQVMILLAQTRVCPHLALHQINIQAIRIIDL